MTALQEVALQGMNDSWGVDSWIEDQRTSDLIVKTDDGEIARIAPDGLVSWQRAA